ncbi:MAG: PAS domain-containing protein [Alphaproteobacteria bacterium]|nr:PAS domain-containing protein [Alphaproteobacteria bacterium]
MGRSHKALPVEDDGRRIEFQRLPQAGIDGDPVFAEVFVWWQRARGSRAMPSRADIDLDALKRSLPRLLLIEVLDDPPDFRYRLAGTQTYDIHGMELTGKSVLDIKPPAQHRRLWNDLCEMLDEKQPQLVRLRFTNQQGNARSYRVMRLPLSNTGDEVDHILVMQDFGAEGPELRQMYEELRQEDPGAATPQAS